MCIKDKNGYLDTISVEEIESERKYWYNFAFRFQKLNQTERNEYKLILFLFF